jgi:hypothetical protein
MSSREQIDFITTKLKEYRTRLGGDKEPVLSPF